MLNNLKTKCFCIVGVLATTITYAQEGGDLERYGFVKDIKSPNASSIEKYGNIPVNTYTGTANITIPLLNISSEEITIPVQLSYTTQGIKVQEQAGIAGLGWSLLAGGQISRTAHHVVDEYSNKNSFFYSNGKDKGYFFFGGDYLNNSNWNTSAFFQNYLDNYENTNSGDLEPDEFNFQFGNYSGSFYRSGTGEWLARTQNNIQIEISHELVSDGSYKLYEYFTANSDVEKTVIDQNDYETVSSLFTGFTIITPDGMKYYFGYDPKAIEFTRTPTSSEAQMTMSGDAKSNRITANTWYLTKIVSPNGDEVKLFYKRGNVLFRKSYSPSTEVTKNSNEFQASIGAASIVAINPSYLDYIETPKQKIEFITSTSIEKGISNYVGQGNSAVLPSDLKKSITQNWQDLNYTLTYPTLNTFPQWQRKLDQIKVWNKFSQSYSTFISLAQSNNANSRRTLDELSISENGSMNTMKYTFEYNNVADMPDYESTQIDHWGYFNNAIVVANADNKNDVSREPNEQYAVYGLINKITYPTGGETRFEYELSDYNKAVYITADKIQPLSIALIDASSNPVNTVNPSHKAGIRLKRIIDNASFNSPEVIRNYYYKTNFVGGGTQSSGILGAIPKYEDIVSYTQVDNGNPATCNGNFTLKNKSFYNNEWTGLSKTVVGYSEVTEETVGGGYTIYKYSNHNTPGCMDELSDQFICKTNTNQITYITAQDNYRTTSCEADRGLLLEKSYYDQNYNKVKSILNQYAFNSDRKTKFVKAIEHKLMYDMPSTCATAWGTGGGVRLWGYKYYTYNNPLIQTEERDFYPDNQYAAKTISYVYDEYGNVTEERITNSDGRSQSKFTKYNVDQDYNAAGTDPASIGLKKLFQQYRIKNYPVEEVNLLHAASIGIPSKNMGSHVIKYDENSPVIKSLSIFETTEPLQVYNSVGYPSGFKFSKINSSGIFETDNRYKTKYEVSAYANTIPKKIASVIGEGNINVATTYDYSGMWTSSITQNASIANIAYCGFEGDYSGNNGVFKNGWSFNGTSFILPPNDNPIAGRSAMTIFPVNSLSPAVAVIQSTITMISGKKYTLSFWTKNPISNSMYLANGSTVTNLTATKTLVSGWRFYQVEFISNGQPVGLLCYGTGTLIGYLDEVMLHPAESMMKSYSYDKQSGQVMTENNSAGSIINYEYDGLGRLLQVRDEDRNLLKTYEYQYQQN